MQEDQAKLLDADGVSEIKKENIMLEEKHRDLLKEIEEKTELMEK